MRANYVNILTGTTRSQFSRIRSSMIFYLKNTIVAVEVPTHQKFEENRVKRFRDMSEQTFEFFSLSFLHNSKITVTRKLVLQSC